MAGKAPNRGLVLRRAAGRPRRARDLDRAHAPAPRRRAAALRHVRRARRERPDPRRADPELRLVRHRDLPRLGRPDRALPHRVLQVLRQHRRLGEPEPAARAARHQPRPGAGRPAARQGHRGPDGDDHPGAHGDHRAAVHRRLVAARIGPVRRRERGAQGRSRRAERHVRRRRRAGRGGRGAARDRRLPRRARSASRASARRSRAACCCTARRAAARRCWRARSPARPARRSTTSREPSSSSCTSASARRGCATCSRRRARTRRRSSSSTSSTRSASGARRGERLGRERRAGAGAQPDPHRDGRLRRRARASSWSARPTGPTCSTPRCCGRAASTARSGSSAPTRRAGWRSCGCTRATGRWRPTSTSRRSRAAPSA